MDNLVLLTFQEAEAHEASDLQSVQQNESELCEKMSDAIMRIHHDLRRC